eukprot:3145874-Prymnesium_polylepis.1
MRTRVTVPDGLEAGDKFNVSHNTFVYPVIVPDGVKGGDLLDVDLLGEDTELVTVMLPKDAEPGQLVH